MKNSLSISTNTDKSKQENPSFKRQIPLASASAEQDNLKNSNNNNVTVESLLLSLDKIEKESESLLQFEKKPVSNQTHGTSNGNKSKDFENISEIKYLNVYFRYRIKCK